MEKENKEKNPIFKLYDNLSFFDTYGGSVLLLIIVTIVTTLACVYCYVIVNIQAIKDDWVNQRCKPYILPFAGMIYKQDPSQTVREATQQNFEYCQQNMLKPLAGDAVQPLTFIVDSLDKAGQELSAGTDAARGMFDKMRANMQSVSEEIMGRALNITVPIQQLVINFKDMMGKIQGTMTAALFTLLGSMYGLKAVMGAIAELIIKILIAMAAMIVIFWIIPFTWGIAASMTAVFISISIPMAIILVFLSEHLHVHPGLSLPSVPKKHKCFDEDTLLDIEMEMEIEHTERNTTNNRTRKMTIKKPISKIRVGDRLGGANRGATVTAIIKVETSDSLMYAVGNEKNENVLVSDTHLIKDVKTNKWVQVSEHPDAQFYMNAYDKRVLYCMNTTSKTIHINGYEYADWDDLVDKELDEFIKRNSEKTKTETETELSREEIHCKTDGGFIGETMIPMNVGGQGEKNEGQKPKYKEIKDIKIGDVLYLGVRVYGIVEINAEDMEYIYKYSFGGKGGGNIVLEGGPNIHIDKYRSKFIMKQEHEEKYGEKYGEKQGYGEKQEQEQELEYEKDKEFIQTFYINNSKLTSSTTKQDIGIEIEKYKNTENNMFLDLNNDEEIKDDGEKKVKKVKKIYHLLTDKSFFYIKNLKIHDYNSCIDLL